MKAKSYFEKAKVEHFAIGAFNAASIETLKAIVGAAQKLKSPVMIEASQGEVEFVGITEMILPVVVQPLGLGGNRHVAVGRLDDDRPALRDERPFGIEDVLFLGQAGGPAYCL